MKSLWISLFIIYAPLSYSYSEILQKDPLLIQATHENHTIDKIDREGEDDPSILKDAQAGDPLAEYAYGMVQYQKNNFKNAATWFLKSANQGHENAQFNLGKMFAEGTGVAKSNAKAYFFFSLSADKKFEPAIKAKVELEKKMSKEQKEDAMNLYEQYKVKK